MWWRFPYSTPPSLFSTLSLSLFVLLGAWRILCFAHVRPLLWVYHLFTEFIIWSQLPIAQQPTHGMAGIWSISYHLGMAVREDENKKRTKKKYCIERDNGQSTSESIKEKVYHTQTSFASTHNHMHVRNLYPSVSCSVRSERTHNKSRAKNRNSVWKLNGMPNVNENVKIKLWKERREWVFVFFWPKNTSES